MVVCPVVGVYVDEVSADKSVKVMLSVELSHWKLTVPEALPLSPIIGVGVSPEQIVVLAVVKTAGAAIKFSIIDSVLVVLQPPGVVTITVITSPPLITPGKFIVGENVDAVEF